MNKIKRSGKLLKAAFAVLFREKKLLLFPFVAFTLVMIVALFFIAPIVLYPTGHSIFSTEHWNALGQMASHWFNLESMHDQHEHPAIGMGNSGSQVLAGHPWTAAAFAVMYFVSMFLATFSNVAFYHEIMRALNGNSVSIRRGYRFACERWRAVLLWSLFAGLVGYLIQMIQERVGFFGRLVTGLIGFVWSVACIFIIPTLVRDTETSNPLKLLRNSVGTLRNTWGELVIGFVGLELAFSAIFMFALLIAVVVPGLFAFYLGFHFNWPVFWIVMAGVGAMFLIALPLSWISSIVNPIYRCALYIYATEGVIPEPFDKELLDSAWKVK
ncbi:MAG TPA: DUF6159 family protein [Verrucomicrobiae bacterium]|nr:DUF6159 family protein [Verrucomicrobiae bacterium]